MIRNLRTLLVTLAGLSTILAGMTTTLGNSRFPAPSIRAFTSGLTEGSREDDSGRPAEESEEDDNEKQGGREVHLFATVLGSGWTLEGRCFAGAEATCGKPRLHRLSSPIRGPPALV